MKKTDAKARRMAPLQTPTDLGAQATKDISAALNLLLADLFALYLKTKNFHWHVSGPHFRDYHLLLDEQADQIYATTDPVAERVRNSSWEARVMRPTPFPSPGPLPSGAPAFAQPAPFPKSFRTQEITANGATLHVRVGGQGPAVVLLHGYGETGDMWSPLAADLARDHRVVVPDLRGLGLSSRPADGYDQKTQAGGVAGVLDALGIDRVDLVTHDIGNMVGFAFAAQHPDRVTSFVIMDAPVPGVGPWEEVLKNPLLWHFHFGGPDAERLVAGRERIYLDRFWNEFAADPKKFSEGSRRHYAQLYAKVGAMHAGFAQFAAFDQDAVDNRAFLAHGRLSFPMLAVGGEKSFGTMQAFIMRFAADDVTAAVIPNSGHWLMEEQPAATVAVVRPFLDAHSGAQRVEARRLTPEAIEAL